MHGAHGLPRDIVSLTNELQQLIHDVGKQNIDNGIQPRSEQRYARGFRKNKRDRKGKIGQV